MSSAMFLFAAGILLWPNVNRRLPGRSSVKSISLPQWMIPAGGAVGALSTAIWIGGICAGCAVAVAGATAAQRYRKRSARNRRNDELHWLTTGIEVMMGELRVGTHPATACAVAADDCDGIATSVLRGAAARSRLGGSLADGLVAPESCVAPELARLAAAWRVADEHGLALAELLEAVREDMLGRRRFRERTEATLAGARATALVLAALPALGVALGQMMGADPVRILLGGGLGGTLLLVGVVLGCAGLLWTDRITGKVTS